MPVSDAAILTKARAMTGRLLTQTDFDELSRHTSVADAASWLSGKPAYADVFAGADLTQINRSRLEYMLECSILSRMLRLYHFAVGLSREFMGLLLAEYEIHYLLLILQRLLSGAKQASAYEALVTEVLMIPPQLAEYSKLDFSALMAAADTGEFLEKLNATDYFAVLKPLVANGVETDFSLIETEVYNVWRGRLSEMAQKSGKTGRAQVCAYLDCRTDSLNISRAMRLKRFAEYTGRAEFAGKSERYLQRGGTKRCKRAVEAIISAPDVKSAEIYYNAYFRGETESEHKRELALKVLRRSQGITLAPVFGYLTLADEEAARIIQITEVIRYS